MKIRLILPICKRIKPKKKKYCKLSISNKTKRLEILQNVMEYDSNSIDLVVTSNNFFEFTGAFDRNLKNRLNKIVNKKDLLLGIDIFGARNPFNGISSKVLYYKAIENNYSLKTSIWETWNDKVKKNKITWNAFTKQNKDRVIEIFNKKICLLSCGDILAPVHKSGDKLPNSNIYLDLAHLNFSNWLIRDKVSYYKSNIQKWKTEKKIVLITQQLSLKNLYNKHYFENEKYKLIYPKNIFESQKIKYFDTNHKEVNFKDKSMEYIIIDIQIKD